MTNEWPMLNQEDSLKANRQIRYRRIPDIQLQDIKDENRRTERNIILVNGFIRSLCTKQEYTKFHMDMLDIDFGSVD